MKERERAAKQILGYLDLSNLVGVAYYFGHITTDEAGLHQAEIARDVTNIEGIAILSDDQRLPEVPDGIKQEYHGVWVRAFLSMYSANFKRVI